MAFKHLDLPDLSMRDAELATGYVKGRATWPYTMLAWLGQQGLDVKHIENTDLDVFIQNPQAELERQGFDTETIDFFYDISDFDKEAAAIQSFRTMPNVSFEQRLPEVSDIKEGLRSGWLPLVSLDAGTLVNDHVDEFDGHMVIATDMNEHYVRIQDSGPPAQWDLDVTEERLQKAMRTPIDNAGTVTLIRRKKTISSL